MSTKKNRELLNYYDDESLKHALSDNTHRGYPTEIGWLILTHLANGMTLKQISSLPGMPHMSTISAWATGVSRSGAAGVVAKHYRHARAIQAAALTDRAYSLATALHNASTKTDDIPCDDIIDGDSKGAIMAANAAMGTYRWLIPLLDGTRERGTKAAEDAAKKGPATVNLYIGNGSSGILDQGRGRVAHDGQPDSGDDDDIDGEVVG